MSDAFDVTIPDLDSFVARHANSGPVVAEELKRAHDRSGAIVERRGKERVKKKTRHLARSTTFATTVQGFAIETKVGTAVLYGRYLDKGTGIYGPKKQRITPKTKKALAFTVGGQKVVVRSVKGIPGDEWFTGAWEETKPLVRREFAEVPKRIVNRMRKGG